MYVCYYTPILADNLTFGIGLCNPGALDASVGTGLYDDLTRPLNSEEENYFELAATGLSNTYESVTSAYSTTETQVRSCK